MRDTDKTREALVAELEELRRTNTVQKHLIENSSDLISLLDPDGVLRYVNRRAHAEILGYDAEDLLGKDPFVLVHPEDLETAHRDFQELLDHPEATRSSVFRCRRKDGSWCLIETRCRTLLRDAQVVGLIANGRDVTDRLQRERALAHSQRSYRYLFESMRDGVVTISLDGSIQSFNPSFREMLRYPEASLLRLTRTEITPERWHALEARIIEEQVLRRGYSDPFEKELLRRDGTVVPVELRTHLLRDERGNAEAMQSIVRDVTERKRAEAAQRESEGKLSAMLRSLGDHISMMDRELNIVWANDVAKRLFGDDIIGRKCYEVYHGAEKPCEPFPCLTLQAFEDGRIHRHDTQVRTPGGDRLHYACTASVALRDVSGQPTGVVEVSRDITEWKRTEEALRRERDFSRSLLQASPAFFVAIDANGRTMMMNERMLTALGYTESEVVGTSYLETFVPPADRARVAEVFDRLMHANEPTLNQNRIRAKDGRELLVEWHGVSAQQENGGRDFFFGVGIDVTERRRLEEEIHRTRSLESLAILAGGLAHDFNNLLTPVLANVSIAKTYGNLEPEIAELLTDVEKASLRAKGLTQQLLTFAKGGAPIKKPTSLSRLLQDTARFALSGSNVRCELFLPEDLWPVEVDEGQISQVIHNLVMNADQAMAEGGTLRIRAENRTIQAGDPVNLRAGRYVRISIEDQGHGIPHEHLAKVFDPFFSTKERGRGLGLATCHSIVTRHEGRLHLESRMGEGTTFRIHLPASAERPEPGERKRAEPIRGEGNVLVIDDEETIRKSASAVLRRLGYRVRAAKDHEEGIRLYGEAMDGEHPFDAVLMDLTVPGSMGGQEAVRRLLRIDPDARVIVSSGYSDDRTMSRFREYGFCGVIKKPYEIQELARVIHAALADAPRGN